MGELKSGIGRSDFLYIPDFQKILREMFPEIFQPLVKRISLVVTALRFSGGHMKPRKYRKRCGKIFLVRTIITGI